jgi:glycerol-3-phosphate acyltransferase PlsX
MSELKGVFKSGFITKLSALMVKNKMSELKNRMNPDSVGGTALLGISKPVIKAHGSSNAAAIQNAIRQSAFEASSNIAARFQASMERMKISEDRKPDEEKSICHE